MSLKLGVVMDPIGSIHYKKDSTLAMLLAAQARGYELHYMEQTDLFYADNLAQASMVRLEVSANPQTWFRFLGERENRPLHELDVILMRKDPPFDMDYIYTTYMLELAEQRGCLIVNKPQSLRDANEKFFVSRFPPCAPPTLVSSNAAQISAFLNTHADIIVKPLDGMGGTGIFRLRRGDPNLNVILETQTLKGKRLVMAQRYLPEIREGDKRILLVDGEPIPYALARIPAEGETRGNLAAGGKGVGVPLSERDYWICEQVAPTLRAMGLIFVGVDVIGDYLTEINVTSPTCIRELDAQFKLNIGDQLMVAIETRLAKRS